MNPEIYQILIVALSGTLFALGGTEISHRIAGQKWIRRFLLPAILGIICYFTGFAVWRCIGFWATQTGVLHLGYGEKLPYWRKCLTAIAYILPSLFLGFSWWQLIFPPLFLSIFFLSNLRFTANIFKWLYCEIIVGVALGITVSDLIHMTY